MNSFSSAANPGLLISATTDMSSVSSSATPASSATADNKDACCTGGCGPVEDGGPRQLVLVWHGLVLECHDCHPVARQRGEGWRSLTRTSPFQGSEGRRTPTRARLPEKKEAEQ